MNWIIYQNVGLGICKHLWVLTSRGHLWGSCLEMANQNPCRPKDFACLCPGQWRDNAFSAAGEMWRREYFGHLMWRADSFEKTLLLGKIEGRREWQRMRRLDGITDSKDMSWVNSGSWWWTGRPGVLQSIGSQRVGCDWVTELNWASITERVSICSFKPPGQL